MVSKQYEAPIIKVYSDTVIDVNGDPLTRVFYRIEKVLTTNDIIINKPKDETTAQVIERYDKEEHWLADYGDIYKEKHIAVGDTVIFSVKASKYYPYMKHPDRKEPFKARNIEVSTLNKKK